MLSSSVFIIVSALVLSLTTCNASPAWQEDAHRLSELPDAVPATSNANDIAHALVYGYPLTLYVQTFYPVIEAVGVNVPKSDNITSSASGASLVRPNADYVYSPMAVDLSHDNVLITVPNITDGRSYVFPFYDLYGNNFANLGAATSSPPGTYLMRPAGSRTPGVTMFAPNSTISCGYRGAIDFPTVYGSMEIRILLRKTSDDLANVHRYQKQIQTLSVRRETHPIAPALTTALLQNGTLARAAYSAPNQLDKANATQLLQLLAKLAPYNAPENASLTGSVNAMLARAGITNGSFVENSVINMTLVNEIIEVNHTRVLTPNEQYWDYHGGSWWDLKTNESGDFHTFYLIRAYIAYTGYLQLRQQQALYPEYFGSGAYLSLLPNESYIFTFSGKPPTQFWSITIYGEDNYLISNPLKIFSIGSTSEKLSYPDGTKVYPAGQEDSQKNSDASGQRPFQLLIQSSKVTPPTNWTNNWIPSQGSGGLFTVNFRTYGPSAALSDGQYIYPKVTKQKVLA